MATQSQLEQPLVERNMEQIPIWMPERMDPGTVFLLENQTRLGDEQNPFVAVMSCPRCGTLGLVTRHQLYAGEFMICGGDVCSAEWNINGETFTARKPQ
jgi:hypothetical protein